MRFFCASLLLLASMAISMVASAQTVAKSKGDKVVVTVGDGQTLAVGQEIRFLNDDLSEAGIGKVTKISEGGRALVHLELGHATVGMIFEKKGTVQTPPPAAAPVVTQKDKRSDYERRYDELSPDDKKIWDRGPMNDGQYIGGGAVGSIFGFGLGHAIQGRYADKGWIFTVGETLALTAIVVGFGECAGDAISGNSNCSSGGGTILLGFFGYLGLHTWEIVDLWWTPHEQEERYRQLRGQMQGWTIEPSIRPIAGGGETFGVRLTF